MIIFFDFRAELIRNNPTCGIKYSQSNLAFLICGITTAFTLSIISNFPVIYFRKIVDYHCFIFCV